MDNPTFAHRLRLPLRGPSGGQTGLPTPRPPPIGLKTIFLHPPGRHSRGEPPGVPERGGCKPHRGLGAQPPAVGAEGGAGRAGGSNTPPSGGLLFIRFRARKNLAANAVFFGLGLFGRLLMFAAFAPKGEQCQPNDEQAHYENLRKS